MAHHQVSDRKPTFSATIPMADMRSSRAKRISKEFIAISAAVCTEAHQTGCQPEMAHTPSGSSSKPIALVAVPPLSVPKILPTIKRCRGIPLRILLYSPWKIHTDPIPICTTR